MDKLKKLVKIQDVNLRFDVNLERYTTIKLAKTGHIAICTSEKGLRELISHLKHYEIKYHLVGWGANQVLVNCDKTLFIKLDFPFDKNIFNTDSHIFELPASVSLGQLTSIAMKKKFKGWEVFTGIPGSLGGAICMNAGTSLGEIGNLIESVRVLRENGSIESYKCTNESFKYRHNCFLNSGDIILSAKIKHNGYDETIEQTIKEYLAYRKDTQPLTTKNCGSVFKNLPHHKAGVTIDIIGLKGFGTKNISVSMKHANFIENKGEGSAAEFKVVIDLLKQEIERHSGFQFELEVKVY
ncbi:MAG: FAD-binding protein [Bacteriovoracaceae bacterium]|jgi:UDP-N-acetylmuramate dehydrogenase|nr:FAD-binding protein [Bacteriovoracaceae bacterium]